MLYPLYHSQHHEMASVLKVLLGCNAAFLTIANRILTYQPPTAARKTKGECDNRSLISQNGMFISWLMDSSFCQSISFSISFFYMRAGCVLHLVLAWDSLMVVIKFHHPTHDDDFTRTLFNPHDNQLS